MGATLFHMTPLSRAIEIAVRAHDGQTDKAGLPYILHPLRLMLRAATDDERVVAVLHDVVEDSVLTLVALSAEFSATITCAVGAITRVDGEAYAHYIERVAGNPLARRVKMLDLRDNLDPARASTGKLSNRTIAKYTDALERLTKIPAAAVP